MARIAFLLLCHRDPEGVIAQVRALTAAGDYVAIHVDAQAPDTVWNKIEAAFRGTDTVTMAKRVRCGWGEWSLVQATLNTAEAALAAFSTATHFYMVSGDCRPIKSAVAARAVLDAQDIDRIESVDYFTSGWIRTGPVEERLVYRHWFNERTRKWLFYTSMDWQRRVGLRREIPEGIDMRIGSQWWCLRRGTVERVLDFCGTRPDVLRFFRTTWIPDETFFQTLVAHLVSKEQIDPRPPTFLTFTDYGMPTTFYNDHHDMLVGQPELFARKIGAEAQELRTRLDALWASDQGETPLGAKGRAVVSFVTGRGRIGRRFGRRIWEAGAELGDGRHLVVIVCRDQGIGNALAQAISAEAGVPALGYVFHDPEAAMPDLGGIETSLAKRTRHRRVVLRMLYDRLVTDRLAICTEPGDLELLWDVQGDRADLRVLLVDSVPTEAELRDRATLAGLIGPNTSEAEIATLVPTLAEIAREEAQRVADAEFAGLVPLSLTALEPEHAINLAKALGCEASTAGAVLRATRAALGSV